MSMILLAVVVLSSAVTLYYYQGYVTLAKEYSDTVTRLKDISYNVNILIKYGNGTKAWHNRTFVPIGWALFNATLKVTNGMVDYTTLFGSPFITAINGVKGGGSRFWMWYVWNSTSATWQLGEVGADQHILRDGETVAWYLVDTSTYPNLPKP